MHQYTYQLDDELRAIEDPAGYRELGFSRKLRVPSDTIQNLMEPIREFRDKTETRRQKFLEEVQKGMRIEQNKKAMEIVKRHGMMVMATLMIGFWDETEEDRRDLMKFVRPYVDHFGLNVITPFPGTKFFEEMERLGRLKTKDWSKYDMIEAVMDTRYNTAEEITEAHISMMRKYYWHPRELWKTFFSCKPILRHHHWHFLRIGVTAFEHEVFGSPMWVQENYQTFDDYLKERGRPLAPRL